MVNRINAQIRKWEKMGYPNGIPDEAPKELEHRNLVLSYKMIAICILKNDYTLKSLGINMKPCKSYHLLKRIQLGYDKKQLKLF